MIINNVAMERQIPPLPSEIADTGTCQECDVASYLELEKAIRERTALLLGTTAY